LDGRALALVDIIDEHRAELAERVLDRLRQEVPSYLVLRSDEVSTQLIQSIRFVCAELHNTGEASQEVLDAFAELGRTREAEGIDVDDLARAIRITVRVAMDFAQDYAVTAQVNTAATFALAAALWDSAEAIIAHLAPPSGLESEQRARDAAERRFVKACVSGEASAEEITAAAAGCGVDPHAGHHVLRVAVPVGFTGDSIRATLRAPSVGATAITRIDDEIVALTTQLPVGVGSLRIGAGPAMPASSARFSYLVAGRVLRTAALQGRSGLVTLDSVGLAASVLHDPAMGDMLMSRYLGPLRAMGSFGELLLDSLRTFLSCDQNTDDAARQLFVHPNTLRHRLGRFEQATGCNLRRAETLAEVWWVLTRLDLDATADSSTRR
jgi:hypothetical protein